MSTLERVSGLSANRRQLLEMLLKEKGVEAVLTHAIPRRADDAPPPLSFAQQRLWFLNQLAPGNAFYNCDTVVPIRTTVDRDAVERAVNVLVRRHETLRTTFGESDDGPVQIISPELHIPLKRVDLRSRPVKGRRAEGLRLAREMAVEPFDLSRGPLLRTTLITLGDADHLLVITMHHIISDGWSLGVFFREFQACYTAFCAGREPSLPELPIQYADFSVWQQQWLSGDRMADLIAYWKQQLRGIEELRLPTDRMRPAFPSFAGQFERIHLSLPLSRRLKNLAHREGATLFMVLLAAYKTLLARYSGQDDIVVGSPIANRNQAELENLVGFFVNTLVMRTSVAGNPTFRELVQRVKQTALGAYNHQDLPFERLVDELQPQRDLSRNPLFQVSFQFFATVPTGEGDASKDSSLIEVQRGTSKFDLRLDLWESSDGLRGQFEYSIDLYEADSIQRMIAAWTMLLESVAVDPDRPLSEIAILPPADQEKIVVEWNRTASDYPRDRGVHELFEQQAATTPSAIALDFGGQQITYAELDRRADAVATYIGDIDLPAEAPIGVFMERSPEFIVSILGILKAGCAYVPLDTNYPLSRLEFMLEDAGASVVLTTNNHLQKLPVCKSRVETVANIEAAIGTRRKDRTVRTPFDTNRLAYVMYTSGSTGCPKGVCIPHRGINRLVLATNYIDIQTDDVVAHLSNISFDASTLEIWGPLLNGARMSEISRDIALSPTALANHLRTAKVSVMFMTTCLFNQVIDAEPTAFSTLRVLMVGGSLCDPRRFHRLMTDGPPARFLHVYGPTENTTYSTFHVVEEPPPADRAVPIGRPLANSTAYILDPSGQIVPVGVPGELYVGGDGLALGYLNRPELTAEQFVKHPFSDSHDAKLYRTGDRVRYLANGSIEFLGRLDNQIKIRGFRVELGEISSALQCHDSVNEAVAMLREDAAGDQRIVAYVTVQDSAELSSADEVCEEEVDKAVAEWKRIYDEVIYCGADEADAAAREPGFNTTGWRSTYTGDALSTDEMREQVRQTVERIAAGQPRRVLEIGCGMGLLLFPLLSRVEKYTATDFSETALAYVRRQLKELGCSREHVQLFKRMANDFDGWQPGSFDAVILNSVVQYFPSLGYLRNVLAGAAKVLAPGGRIFVGDVRSAPLLRAFHTSVALAQAPGSIQLSELANRIESRIDQDWELSLAPAFFAGLQEELPKVSRVCIQQKRGWHDNELTRFRYDVVIEVNDVPAAEPPDPETISWSREQPTLDVLRQRLVNTRVQRLLVTDIPNGRLSQEAAVARLTAREGWHGETDTLRQRLSQAATAAIHPESIWSLGDELPYDVYLTWSEGDEVNAMDALFVRCESGSAPLPIAFPNTPRRHPTQSLANDPLKGRFLRNLVPQLRDYVQQRLPEYMHPAAYVLVPSMPLNANGKVDLPSLPAPDESRRRDEGSFRPPQTPTEQSVAAIWASILGLQAVGADDGFFTELGGNSLLATQAISQIRVRLRVEVPLRHIFEHPTLAAFSALIDQLRSGALEEESAVSSITPAEAQLVPLDVDAMSDDDVERMLAEMIEQQEEGGVA